MLTTWYFGTNFVRFLSPVRLVISRLLAIYIHHFLEQKKPPEGG